MSQARQLSFLESSTSSLQQISNSFVFSTNSTERLRITATGGIAFGGSSNFGSAGQVLQSNGNASPTWVNATTLQTGFKNIGTISVQAVAGSNVSCTTAQFISWYQTNYTFKSFGYTVAKCAWDYAGNNDISDTSIGACEMAGSVIETFSDGTNYTIRITRPTTGTGLFVTLVYNDQGGGYSPGWRTDINSTNYSSFSPTLTGTGASGTWGINITGNAATATNLSTDRTNWATNGTITAVVGQLAWKHYGNNHTIFDASTSTSPNGGAVNNTNSASAWTPTYPTLMGWNGSSTYGVRVDSARVADSAGSATTAANYLPLAGGTMTGLLIGRVNTGGGYAGSNDTGSFSARGDSSQGAFMSFHRAGVYAINVGLDTDNIWKVGGWSAGSTYVGVSAGQLLATSEVTAYYSDSRLKTNLGNITGALEAVTKLNGFRYTNNELAKTFGYTDEKVQLGVNAQEVEELFPEIVTVAPFDITTDPETGKIISKSGENYKTVRYEKLIPVLIEAIKEQQQQINQLIKTVAALSNK